METPVSRRTLLGAGSAAVALSVAGCSALDDSTDEKEPEPKQVTFVAEIDDGEIETAQEEARATQQEAQRQLEEGEIDEEEYQQILQEAQRSVQQTQQDLLSGAIDDLESHAEETDGLTIAESAPESGVALGEGDGNVIIDALALDSVQAILDADEFEAFTED
jgi:TolA-binding protein